MKPLRIRVEYVETAEQLALRDSLASSQAALEKLRKDYQRLEVRFGYEVTINNELVDLCRTHGIRYRSALDSSTWDK